MLEKEAYEAAAREAATPEFDEPISPDPAESAVPGLRIGDLLPDISFIFAETGPGSIDEYKEHPLNMRGSMGMAQILRGLTGMAGTLNYAIIDIGLGFIQLTKEGKEIRPHDKPLESGE